MSIRDDLMALLIEKVDFWDDDPGPAVDAILARYAVIELPDPNGGMGIEWKSHGDLVSGRVLAVGDDGEPFEILSITYTIEQAAQVAGQLIDAIGGKQ